jgi:hypothetical protein
MARRHARLAALLLVGLGPASALLAQPMAIVDLADVPTNDGRLLRVRAALGTGEKGLPVAGGWDLDNDGFEDYAIGSLHASPDGRDRAGVVSLVFGDGTISGEIDLAVPQARALVIWGDQDQETAGNTIWIDDVTGDGIGDLLICRQNYTPGEGRLGAGALTIVKGGPELKTFAAELEPFDLRDPDPALTITHVVGVGDRDRFCVWARTGDVAGDGAAEILVGADQEDGPDAATHAGAAYLLLGGPHLGAGGTLDLSNLAAPALAGKVARIEAPPGYSHHHMGGTVLVADLDGNDKGEVLIAVTLNRITQTIGPDGDFQAHGNGGSPDGRVFILWDDSFTTPWSAVFELEVDDPPGTLTTIEGASIDVNFGEDMVGGLDYDGDGKADLFVGDLTADDTGGSRPFSGIGWVFYDAESLKGQSIDLDAPPPGLSFTKIRGPINVGVSFGTIGADTSLHGDYDGDGIADLAFCSPLADPQGRTNAGMIHVFRGKVGGWPALIDTAALPPPSQVQTVEIHGANGTSGSDTGDILCYSAASGDVDGDGLADLIVNEMEGNGSSTVDAGTLLVIRGAFLFPLFQDGFESGDMSAWSASASAPP